jgi:hypothetical protein
MTTNHSPASPGSATVIVSESPIRNPLAGAIWTTPTLSIPLSADAQIVRVPNARVDQAGGPLNRQ